VQSAAGLGEGTGSSRHWCRRARVGDRAQQAGPGLEQSEPDRAPQPGIPGYRQGVPHRAGHQLRHHDRDVVAAFGGAPPVRGGEGEVPGCADRSGVAAEGTSGDPRRAVPAASGGMRRWPPLARPAVCAASISHRQPLVLASRCDGYAAIAVRSIWYAAGWAGAIWLPS
jgi:hypothetical protein